MSLIIARVKDIDCKILTAAKFKGFFQIFVTLLNVTSKVYRMGFGSCHISIIYLVKSLIIARFKDIDCKIFKTANFTVYLKFFKLCQNDRFNIFLAKLFFYYWQYFLFSMWLSQYWTNIVHIWLTQGCLAVA